MKKKHIKFKPLQELYNHDDVDYTLLNSNSKVPGLSEVSLETSTVYQASAEELSRERKGHRQIPSSEANTVLCTSCQSSYSEEFQSHSKATGQSKDLPMLHSDTSSQNTDVFDCQGDNSSCISKDDGAAMISGDHFGVAGYKNVTYSAPSVSSACPDVFEKSLDDQAARIGCPADQLLVEDDTSSMRAHKISSEAELPSAGLSGGLGPSLTSFRDERDDLDHKINEKSSILADTEAGLSDDYPSATVLNNFDDNEYSKSNLPSTSTQEPHLQSENVTCGNGSEELVDVRVCDICGDLGREALLALCSKCSDGAEHIYCMSPKMDKVPEGDWLCEECLLARDAKRPRQAVVEQSYSPSKPSCLNGLSQGSPTINSAVQHVYKRRENHMSGGSCLSDKRLGSAENVRSEMKKRSVARSVEPVKASGSILKSQLTRAASLKSLDKRKDPARQVSSFVDLPAKKVVKQTCSSGDRSPKPEQKFCGGSLNNGKSVNSSNSNMEKRHSHFVYRRRSSVKEKNYVEKSYIELKKDYSDNKVFKSLSSTVGGSIPMNASNAHASVSSKKDLTYGSGKKYKEKSMGKKANQQVLSVAGSTPMKVGSSITKGGSKNLKVENSSKRNVEDKKAIVANGNAKVKACSTPVHEGENCAKPLVSGSVKERKSPCHSSYAINPSAKSVNADCDQRVNGVTEKSEIDDLTRDKNDQLVASHKSLSFDSIHANGLPTLNREVMEHMVPFAISAVPESSCIWKGIFRVEKSQELPTDCYGVQAHLSTRASSKVAELVCKFSPEILLKVVPRLNSWPIQFQKNHPTEQDIALYFFAQDLLSYGRRYKMLLESMTNNDLALEASFGGFQLLVFPSSLLPASSQCWNTLPYLWGVLRARRVDVCSLFPPSLNIETMNKGLHSAVTSGADINFASVPVTGGAFAAAMAHHSLQGPEYAGSVVLQSPALVKSEDQSIDYKDSSLKKNIAKLQSHDQADTNTYTHTKRKEDSVRSLYNDDSQKGNRFSVEDPKSISIIDIARNDQTTREHTTTIGFCPNEIYDSPGFTGLSDLAPEPWQRHDFGAGITFSLDSGPSGSSDGRVADKSADESQVEPLNNELDLNLCLGNGAKSEETIDLDLALGIPTRSKYQPKHLSKDGSRPDGNVSLVLSLGMPFSTS